MDEDFLSYAAVALGVVAIIGIVFLANFIRRRPKKLDAAYYCSKWQAVQRMLKDRPMWPLAIIDADKLLEEALKTRKYRGKTMAERLVDAQRDLSQNDLVWFGHKLRNKLVHEPDIKLKKNDVRDALLGMRLALKDLGAFDEE